MTITDVAVLTSCQRRPVGGWPWWLVRKSLFLRSLRGWGHMAGRCDESSYWRTSKIRSAQCLVWGKPALWENLAQVTYRCCYCAWSTENIKMKQRHKSISCGSCPAPCCPQHTLKTSSLVCCYQPHLFSPALHWKVRTGACGRSLVFPDDSWVIPVWADPNAAWRDHIL